MFIIDGFDLDLVGVDYVVSGNVSQLITPVSRTGSRDSLLVERRTRDRKVATSNLGRSGRRLFFSRVNFLC